MPDITIYIYLDKPTRNSSSAIAVFFFKPNSIGKTVLNRMGGGDVSVLTSFLVKVNILLF